MSMFFATARPSGQSPCCEPLEGRTLFSSTELLADINPADSSHPLGFFRSSAGDVYFAATNASNQRMVYVSGGRPEQTVPIGRANGNGYARGEIDGRVLIRSEDLPSSEEFWTTGGTPGDARPYAAGLGDTGSGFLGEARVIGSALYLSTYLMPSTGPHTARLWKASGPDGSSLTLLLEYQINYTGGLLPIPQNFAQIDGQLYFAAKPEASNYQIWKTDGTAAGTVMVARVTGAAGASAPESLVRAGNHIFFRASGPLWKTDGTPQGTGPASTAVLQEATILPDGGRGVYFVANATNNYSTPGGLYWTDGSTPDARLVAPVYADVGWLTRAGGRIYFSTARNTWGLGLWASDGTAAGTRPVLTAGGQVVHIAGRGPVEFDGALYFPGALTTNQLEAELWRTDGTPAGTVMVRDIRPGPTGSRPSFLVPLGHELYYRANDGVHGVEPWRTAAGAPVVTVTGRRVFYNNSAYDGRDPAATAADLAAVAPDKQALRPGQQASFSNVTSYTRGINGVLVEFAGIPPQPLTAEDFVFRVRDGAPSAPWAAAPPPASVALLPSPAAAAVARYAITWPDGAIRNAWLQVTVKAGDRTALAAQDVFYFGNLVGETGDSLSGLMVRAWDAINVRSAIGTPSYLWGTYDFNRDGRVNALDYGLLRASIGYQLADALDVAGRASVAPAGETLRLTTAGRRRPLDRATYNPLLA